MKRSVVIVLVAAAAGTAFAKDLKGLAGLPALAAKPASASARTSAEQLAHRAWRIHDGAGDGDELAVAISAVAADPSSGLARGALACIAGDSAFSLAQLTAMAKPGACDDCADIVRDVAMIDEHSCKWSAAVKDLAKQVKPSAQRAAAEAVVATLTDGDPKHAAAYFGRASVEVVVSCSNCSDNTHDQHKTAKGTAQLAALSKQVSDAKSGKNPTESIVIGSGMRCSADCCAMDVGMLAHERDFLSKVCFAPGTDQVSRVELIGG